jgi:serine/threonine protein kinase
MEQVAAGYKYLIGEDILHRDLKPSNILREGINAHIQESCGKLEILDLRCELSLASRGR